MYIYIFIYIYVYIYISERPVVSAEKTSFFGISDHTMLYIYLFLRSQQVCNHCGFSSLLNMCPKEMNDHVPRK